ncbi:MAG: nuclear transport factor 2 family protein [Gammaproteobacteria bacterium]
MNRSVAMTIGLPLMLAALSLTGCTTKTEESLPANVTSALRTAFNKGDTAACADIYTEDAEIISNRNTPITGRDAIEQYFKDQVSREILFDTDSKLSVVSGDVAMEQGTYRVRNVIQGVDVEYGDYLNVWRKKDGHWKAYRSMYTVTQSRPALVSVQTENDEHKL